MSNMPNESSAWFRGVADGMETKFPSCPYEGTQNVADWTRGWSEGQVKKNSIKFKSLTSDKELRSKVS